jgi:hypothetical protein
MIVHVIANIYIYIDAFPESPAVSAPAKRKRAAAPSKAAALFG